MSYLIGRLRAMHQAMHRIFGPHPGYDPSQDPEMRLVADRQNRVIDSLRQRGAAGSLFEYLIRESWASPEDYREEGVN